MDFVYSFWVMFDGDVGWEILGFRLKILRIILQSFYFIPKLLGGN